MTAHARISSSDASGLPEGKVEIRCGEANGILVEAIQRLRAQRAQNGGDGAPVCKLIQALPGNQYKIILTRAQLERIIAYHYGVRA